MSTRASKYYWPRSGAHAGALHVFFDYADEYWWVAVRLWFRVYLSVKLWKGRADR